MAASQPTAIDELPLTERLGAGKPEAHHMEYANPASPTQQSDSNSFRNIETVAFVVREPKADFELVPVVLDEVRSDEVLVEMKYSGICHTDVVLQQGLLPMVEFPAIFGHEGAGIVRAIGNKVKNGDLKVGDAVTLSFNTCGECKPCTTGHPAFCYTHPQVNHNAVRLSDRSTPARLKTGLSVRSQYFGQSSFAKMSVVNEKCVVKCSNPDAMHLYAPLGCGFQTGAGTVLNILKPREEDSLVIFGLGSVGFTALMASKYLKTGRIIAVDIVQSRLDLAKELGATDTINSIEEADVVKAIKNLTGGGSSFSIDCTGIPKVIESVIASVGPLGTAVLVGVPPAGAEIKLNALEFLLENKKFIGVIEGDSNPTQLIPHLIAMHQTGNFPIDRLCKVYPFFELQKAIHDMHSGRVIKPIIQWT
ncbi:chaperonin 10-like protein [Ilyonectria destructans]|nr:chaperonin 10-like protein [Ilyonectria destructans]